MRDHLLRIRRLEAVVCDEATECVSPLEIEDEPVVYWPMTMFQNPWVPNWTNVPHTSSLIPTPPDFITMVQDATGGPNDLPLGSAINFIEAINDDPDSDPGDAYYPSQIEGPNEEDALRFNQDYIDIDIAAAEEANFTYLTLGSYPNPLQAEAANRTFIMRVRFLPAPGGTPSYPMPIIMACRRYETDGPHGSPATDQQGWDVTLNSTTGVLTYGVPDPVLADRASDRWSFSVALTPNVWHTFAMVLEDLGTDSNRRSVYFDGSLVHTETGDDATIGPAVSSSGMPFYVGFSVQGDSISGGDPDPEFWRSFVGDIGEIVIWDVALDADEIVSLTSCVERSRVRIVQYDYPATDADEVLLAYNEIEVVLPSAAFIEGKEISVKNIGADTVTVATTGVEQLDGVSSGTYVLATPNQAGTFMSDGIGWKTVRSYL